MPHGYVTLKEAYQQVYTSYISPQVHRLLQDCSIIKTLKVIQERRFTTSDISFYADRKRVAVEFPRRKHFHSAATSY